MVVSLEVGMVTVFVFFKVLLLWLSVETLLLPHHPFPAAFHELSVTQLYARSCTSWGTAVLKFRLVVVFMTKKHTQKNEVFNFGTEICTDHPKYILHGPVAIAYFLFPDSQPFMLILISTQTYKASSMMQS